MNKKLLSLLALAVVSVLGMVDEAFADPPDCSEGSYYVGDGCSVVLDDDDFSSYMALLIYSMIPVWFAISGVYLAFGKKHRKLIPVILVIIGILWIIGIYTNTLPVVFG